MRGNDPILPTMMQNLPQSARALQVAIDAMPVGVSWANLSDQAIIFTNRKFTEIFGYDCGDFRNIADWVERTYPRAEDRELVAQTWGAYLASPMPAEVSIPSIEIHVLCRDGSVKTILHSGVILPETGWALATFVDISERKNSENRLRVAERDAAENEAIYRLLLCHSPEMIILSPFDESRRYVSSAVAQITGFTPEEYLALNPVNTFHPEDRELARQVLEKLKKGNLQHAFRYRILRKDGGYRWVEAIVTGYLDKFAERTGGYIATVRDIAEEVEREERLTSENRVLSEMSTLDELTGIANRRAFNQAMATGVPRQERSTASISLMMVDVDYFKRYNDAYGHPAGDACLRTIAQTLKRSVRRDSDLVARFGGEEFAVLMPSTEIAGAEVAARKALQSIRRLGLRHEQSNYGVITVSIGVSCWAGEAELDPELLIEQADRALYRAKQSGRNTYAIG